MFEQLGFFCSYTGGSTRDLQFNVTKYSGEALLQDEAGAKWLGFCTETDGIAH